MECTICKELDHVARKCPQLYTPLYGKLGEGAQKGQHAEEEDTHASNTQPEEEPGNKIL